jgi:hypothetical protein
MTTSIKPTEVSARCSKVSVERSMTRLMSDGPRSATVHSVLTPVDIIVTLITVPNGRVRWAQVWAGAPNHDATPRSVFALACWAGRRAAGRVMTTPAEVVVVRAAVVGGADGTDRAATVFVVVGEGSRSTVVGGAVVVARSVDALVADAAIVLVVVGAAAGAASWTGPSPAPDAGERAAVSGPDVMSNSGADEPPFPNRNAGARNTEAHSPTP